MRVGFINAKPVINPTRIDLNKSQLDLILAATENDGISTTVIQIYSIHSKHEVPTTLYKHVLSVFSYDRSQS